MMMKKIVIIILMSVFTVSVCVAQQNIQTQQQLDRRYQEAIAAAKENFGQGRYSEAKRYYEIAIEIKPGNADLINSIIAEIDKLIPIEANQGRQVEIDTGSDSTSASNYQGTTVPGATLDAKFDWLVRNAESHNTYIVEVTADESIAPRTLAYKGGIDITIVLRGDNPNRTIRLSSHGTMFTVNTDVTFILDGNITLQGHKGNNGSMVSVEGGNLKMNEGTTITDNTKNSQFVGGAGVLVAGGTFEMTGGTIYNNATQASGGGVYVGGIAGYRDAEFNMTDGTISGNTTHEKGGGIYAAGGTFKMTDGTISGNTANKGGGVAGYNFTMRGGTITGNTAHEYGGGVFSTDRNFTKTGGTITGYASSQSSGNIVKDGSGVLARRGHAAYHEWNPYSSSNRLRKETTAGPGTNLSSDSEKNWDQ